MFPKKLIKKLQDRKSDKAFRSLSSTHNLVDFSSNDYLGFAQSEVIFSQAHTFLIDNNIKENGATGSRLLSGNHSLYSTIENQICDFHKSEAALIFNSGYNANIGLLSCVPQRRDIILYDEYVHASIREGLQLSYAKSYKFRHNDLNDLQDLLERSREVLSDNSELYIVTESVFSMDGDSPDIQSLITLSKSYNAHLIMDEAHAVGVFGQGLVSESIFARIVTFGKALGCHGAAILGSSQLRDYLINFSRAFIYTTALSPHSLATIKMAYTELGETKNAERLRQNIEHFKTEIQRLNLNTNFIESDSAIHCCIVPGNENVKHVSKQLSTNGFDVRPILSPTVPAGQERLRFCLHSYNTKTEITDVLELLAKIKNQ